jgi:hypothetical protein
MTMRTHPGKSIAGFLLLVVTLFLGEFSPAVSQTTKAQAAKTQDVKKANTQSPDKKGGDTLTPRGAQRAKFSQQEEATFEKATRSAVIVAPSYRDSGLATLRYTFADAVELKAELERQGYVVRMIPSTEATADGIREALANLKTLLDGSTQATLLFAFMGHGFQDNNGQNYLMTYGADLNNMDKEALSLDEVQKLINASGARRKVIFIDACRNVPGARDAEKPRTMAEFKAAEGTAILLSTKPGAYSYEDSELSHGVFTYYLLEGLRGKAAGADGFVTFRDLSDYVEHSVVAYSMKRDQAQKPLATLHDVGGDFLLATAAPPKPDELKPNTTASQITSDATVMRALATNRSFFVALSESGLALVDAATGQPFAILSEHPDQLKDKAETSNRSLRWFAGDGPDNAAVHLVAEMRGEAMLQLWGRIGKPCPNDQPCSTAPYPLLPGEVRDSISGAVDKTNKGAKALIAGAGHVIGRRTNEAAATVSSSSTAIEKSGLSADSRTKFIWTKFDLTSTAKPQNQGSNPVKR